VSRKWITQRNLIQRWIIAGVVCGALLGTLYASAVALAFDQIQNLSTSSLGSVTPQIAVSGSNIFVVWEDGARNGPFQGCQSMCDIFFRRSTDHGLTWDPPLDQPAVQLSSGSAYSVTPQVVASGTIVLVVWADLGNGVGVAYRRSTDGGKTFGPLQSLKTGLLGLESHQAVVSGSTIHVAWRDNSSIFYTRSTDAGLTFAPAVDISETTQDSDERPHLAVDGNTVAIAWRHTASNSTITFRSSMCSELRTSGRLLDNRTPFQLEFTENIAGVPLTLSKNVLELSENSLKTSPRAQIP
jgi:hypothetical protein